MAWKTLLLGAACLVHAAQSEERTITAGSAEGSATVFRVDAAHAGKSGDRAFATVGEALEAAAQLKRQRSSAAIRIEIADGDYYVAAPLKIGPELSGTSEVTYRDYRGICSGAAATCRAQVDVAMAALSQWHHAGDCQRRIL